MRCFHMPPLREKKGHFEAKKNSLGNTWNPFIYSILWHFRSYFLGLRSYLRKHFGPGPPPTIPKKNSLSLIQRVLEMAFFGGLRVLGFLGPFLAKTGKKRGGSPRKPFWRPQGPLLQALSLSLSFFLAFPSCFDPCPLHLPLLEPETWWNPFLFP